MRGGGGGGLLRCRPVAASCGFPCLTARRGHQSVTAQRRRRFFARRSSSECSLALNSQQLPLTNPQSPFHVCAGAFVSVVRLQPCCQRVTAPKKKQKKKKQTGLKLLSSLCLHPQSIICAAQRCRKSRSNGDCLSRNNVCVTLTQPCEPQPNQTREGGNIRSPLHLKEKGAKHKSRQKSGKSSGIFGHNHSSGAAGGSLIRLAEFCTQPLQGGA